MARVRIPFVAQDPHGNVENGSYYVYQRGTATQVSVYAAESGGSALTQPITITNGAMGGWVVAEGTYDIVVTTGDGTKTIGWDALAFHNGDIFSVGDRVAWYDSGIPVIELWGQITAAGYQVFLQDTFDTNTTAAWASGATWDSSNKWLSVTSGAGNGQRSDWGPHNDAAQVSIDFWVEGGNDNSVAAFFQHTGTDHAVGIAISATGSGLIYNIVQMFGDSFQRSTLGTVVLVTDVHYQLTVTRQGNNTEYHLVRLDTNADVIASTIVAIPGGAQAELGAGIALGDVGWQLSAGGGVGVNRTFLDNITVYTVQQESRDLFVKVTPSGGGTPVTKRIFGIQGSSTQRTDF